MSAFKILMEARKRGVTDRATAAQLGLTERQIQVVVSQRQTVRPVVIALDTDKTAAHRVVANSARRVINQHRDELEALAYK